MQIERNVYLNKLIARKHNGFVKVITGIRRCGKSYLLNTLFYQHLLESGIEDSHIIRFAFDSAQNLMLIGEDLMEIEEGKRKVDPEKFMTYINDKIVDDGMYYLLLDEVQNLGYFEAVLNGYLRKDNVDVYVTGSNSKFLSSDIITEFAGRGDEVHVLPLSFSEFFSVYDGSKEEAFDDYMVYGGLPSVALMQTEEQKVAYLTTQITNVYLRDIVKRYNLQSDEDIGELLDILASGISTLVNPRKLAGTFKSVKGSTISEVTVAKYIGHMAESFLISKAKRYDVKGKHYIDTPFKVYFEDIGLRNARLNFGKSSHRTLWKISSTTNFGIGVTMWMWALLKLERKTLRGESNASSWKSTLLRTRVADAIISSLPMRSQAKKSWIRRQNLLIGQMTHLRKLLLLRGQ